MIDRTMTCRALLVMVLLSLDSRCNSYLIPLKVRAGSYLSSEGSDFMGDIARDRVTIKSLAKLSASSPEEKSKLDQFTPPTNFEVKRNGIPT